MRSICGRRRARIEKRHNYVYVPQNCRKTVPRRLTRMVVALLLVLRRKPCGKVGPNRMPAKYATPLATPLRAIVKAGNNEFTLELTSK